MQKLSRFLHVCIAAFAIALVSSLASAQRPRGQTTHSLKPTPQTIALGYYDASTPPACVFSPAIRSKSRRSSLA